MQTVLVTGSNGFIGKNLIEGLKRYENIEIRRFDVNDNIELLAKHLKDVDIVFHLAGVNRPKDIAEFKIGNVDLTRNIVDIVAKNNADIPIVLPSSIQAGLENPYGISKKQAENILIEYSRKNNAKIYIYRLPNVFGKWCRPNYNSVVATFCYNIANGIEIQISDSNKEIELVYIDDLVNEFVHILSDNDKEAETFFYQINRTFKITLGDLAKTIYQLRDIRQTLMIPDLSDDIVNCLYATYLSYLDEDDFSYKPNLKEDGRGKLFELLKSRHFGQIFISSSHKGVIRGNHYHNTKIEKFCVIKGTAVIKFRHIFKDEVLSYHVFGDNIEVIDIPPGYTHSIENLGEDEMIVLFWASQIFDPEKTDTYFEEV